MEEVDTTESSSDKREDGVTGTTNLHLSAAADVREDITLAHLDQSKLRVVAVCREILQAVASCTKQTQRLEEVLVILGVLVLASQVDGLSEKVPDKSGRGCNANIFRGDVVLHAIALINGQLPPLVDRTTKSPVVLSSIDVVGVVFRVVDVLFRAVTSKPLACDLEFAGACNVALTPAAFITEMVALTISEANEPKHPEQKPDSIGTDILDSANIDSLGVITKPVAKVDTLDIELGELLVAADDAGSQESEESVFDIAMTPVLALDLARTSNVTSAESVGGTSEENEGNKEDGEEDSWLESHV